MYPPLFLLPVCSMRPCFLIKDKVLCAALVDRLTHKAFLVNMTGESYRVKETLNFSTKK